MEQSEDKKEASDSVEDSVTIESNETEQYKSVTKEVIVSNEDVEWTISKIEDQSIQALQDEKQSSLTEIENLNMVIEETQNKRNAHQKIVNSCEQKIMEVKGQKILRRDYVFGIVQKFFGLFLPSVYAIYGTIITNFLLSLTNAASDLSVFWWLLGQNHPKTAKIILGVDYFPGILALTHHLTESLNNQVPMTNIVVECILIGVFYPLAVPICYSIFIMARIRGKSVLEERFHYLATMTTVIRTCFEDPFQLLLSIWFFSTRIIPAPWNSRANFCDTLGNCLDLGSTVAIISFILTGFSMIKGTLDGFQSDDYLGLGTSILINLMFRIVVFSIMIIYLREWILVLLFSLLIINLGVHFKFQSKRSGINILSSSFCSIFQPVVIPENPEIKAVTGISSLDVSTVNKTAFLVTIIQLPVIFIAGISTYFVVTGVSGFKQDVNIAFTTDQFRHITIYLLPTLFILSMVSILVFNYNKCLKWVKLLVNVLLLKGTVIALVLTFIQMPPTPQPLFILTHQKVLGTSLKKIEVSEAVTFSKALLDVPDEGLAFSCVANACKIKNGPKDLQGLFEMNFNFQMGKTQQSFQKQAENTNSIIMLSELPSDRNISIFLASSEELEKELTDAACVSCRNLTNSCKSLIHGRKPCVGGICDYLPTEGRVHSLYSELELPKIDKLKIDRCIVNEFLDIDLYKDILETPYNEGDKLDVQVICREPFPYPSESKIKNCQNNLCAFDSKATCMGDVWKIKDNCERCTGSDFCRSRRKDEQQLGNICRKETGTCVCLKDLDCMQDENVSDEKSRIDNIDCRFGDKCDKPACSTTFNGQKTLVVHEHGEMLIKVHLPHKSCLNGKDSIIVAAIGGGGGSCGKNGCFGGSSGFLVFKQIEIEALEIEDFELRIQVGKGGEENGTSSNVIGPEWWPEFKAEGGLFGSVCDPLLVGDCECKNCVDIRRRRRKRSDPIFDSTDMCDPLFDSDCDHDPVVDSNPLPNSSKNKDTFDENGTFAAGGKPYNKFGKKLDVIFPNSGPLLRSISGQVGYSCDLFVDKAGCLGTGGGGGGLSVGSDEDRTFSQPDSGFGSGGAQGQPGQHGVVVIWIEKGKVHGPEKVATFDSSAIAGIGVQSIRDGGPIYGMSCPPPQCRSSSNKCCFPLSSPQRKIFCPRSC